MQWKRASYNTMYVWASNSTDSDNAMLGRWISISDIIYFNDYKYHAHNGYHIYASTGHDNNMDGRWISATIIANDLSSYYVYTM